MFATLFIILLSNNYISAQELENKPSFSNCAIYAQKNSLQLKNIGNYNSDNLIVDLLSAGKANDEAKSSYNLASWYYAHNILLIQDRDKKEFKFLDKKIQEIIIENLNYALKLAENSNIATTNDNELVERIKLELISAYIGAKDFNNAQKAMESYINISANSKNVALIKNNYAVNILLKKFGLDEEKSLKILKEIAEKNNLKKAYYNLAVWESKQGFFEPNYTKIADLLEKAGESNFFDINGIKEKKILAINHVRNELKLGYLTDRWDISSTILKDGTTECTIDSIPLLNENIKKLVENYKKNINAEELNKQNLILIKNNRLDKINRFRQNLKTGDYSHCGLIVDKKDAIVQIESPRGIKWVKLEQLLPIFNPQLNEGNPVECRMNDFGIINDINE